MDAVCLGTSDSHTFWHVGGDVLVAPLGATIRDGLPVGARWECTLSHIDIHGDYYRDAKGWPQAVISNARLARLGKRKVY